MRIVGNIVSCSATAITVKPTPSTSVVLNFSASAGKGIDDDDRLVGLHDFLDAVHGVGPFEESRSSCA